MGRQTTHRFGFIGTAEQRRVAQDIRINTIGFRGVGISVDGATGQLSGGERQGIAIGRAMHLNSDLIILDEPIVVFALILGLFVYTAPIVFRRPNTHTPLPSTAPPPILLAAGPTFVVGAGGIDLSFPAIIAFSGYVFWTCGSLGTAGPVGRAGGVAHFLTSTSILTDRMVAVKGGHRCWSMGGPPKRDRRASTA